MVAKFHYLEEKSRAGEIYYLILCTVWTGAQQHFRLENKRKLDDRPWWKMGLKTMANETEQDQITL